MDLGSVFGKSDGVSSSTHAAMKKEGVGPYETPPPPQPPPPSLAEQNSQVGATDIANSKKLEDMLVKRGMSREEAQGKIKSQGKSTGVNYK